MTLFVQLYESNTAAVKSEIGTFFEAFPNGVVWGNTNNGQGYDLVLMGQVEPIRINVDEIQARLQKPEYATVAKSLRDIGFYTAVDLFSSYAGQASDLKEWLKDANINRDRNLRLQYLAGLGLNLYESGPIYSEILRYRKFPEKACSWARRRRFNRSGPESSADSIFGECKSRFKGSRFKVQGSELRT